MVYLRHILELKQTCYFLQRVNQPEKFGFLSTHTLRELRIIIRLNRFILRNSILKKGGGISVRRMIADGKLALKKSKGGTTTWILRIQRSQMVTMYFPVLN